MDTRRSFITRSAAGLAACSAGSSRAQGFPARPLTFFMPFPAGGTADLLARTVGQHLTLKLGVPVIVENRPGGGTVIATAAAAKAPPDAHTLLFISNSFVINAKLRGASLPYDGLRAFDPVACMVLSPQVIVVRVDSPFRTLAQLLESGKKAATAASLATVGPATTQHIAAALLQRLAGVQLVYVPFQGSVVAVNALLGGHVDSVLANYAEVGVHIDAGKLRALAVSTVQRLDFLPDVPTVAESGYPGYEAAAWFGIATPAGAPAAAVETLASTVESAINETETRKKLASFAWQPAFMGPRAFGAHLAQQYAQYSRVIDQAGISAE